MRSFILTYCSLWFAQLCWDTTKDRRPLVSRHVLAVEYNTPLLNCQTFCAKTYNTCTMLAYSKAQRLCKLYDAELDLFDMSMDPKFILQLPVDCTYGIINSK